MVPLGNNESKFYSSEAHRANHSIPSSQKVGGLMLKIKIEGPKFLAKSFTLQRSIGQITPPLQSKGLIALC